MFFSHCLRLKAPSVHDLLNEAATLFAFAALISSALSHCAAMSCDHRWLQTMNYSVCKLSEWSFDQKTPTFRRSKSVWWSLRMNIAWNVWPGHIQLLILLSSTAGKTQASTKQIYLSFFPVHCFAYIFPWVILCACNSTGMNMVCLAGAVIKFHNWSLGDYFAPRCSRLRFCSMTLVQMWLSYSFHYAVQP